MSRVALAPGHAREYETIYLLRPNIEREKADKVSSRVGDAVRGTKGTLVAFELWGQRRLAYPIARHHRGVYVYLKYLGLGGTVAELERQLRLDDSVIRFQTVQLRNNVPVADVKVDGAALKVDFEIGFEPDEPELSIERELGLDLSHADRRRRDDRHDDLDGRGDDEDEMGPDMGMQDEEG
jgi:small subunit ribosomal protein S6